jgi:general nucleoside transport system permease protein
VSRSLALEKRPEPSSRLLYGLPALAVGIGLLLGALLLLLMGAHPWIAYQAMAQGAFGSVYGFSETLVKATPLLLAGLGVGIAFRAGFWNIGAEGQLYMGAMGATWVALTCPTLPAPLLQPLMIVSGCLAGAVWGLIPAVLRVRWRVNEIITTLMCNYIAILWIEFLVYGPWKDPGAFGFPFTPPLSPAARLPTLPGSRVHLGLLLGIMAAAGLAVLLARTRLGYEIRIMGHHPTTARYAGMNLARITLLVMAMSAGLAALAGVCEVAGVHGQLKRGLSPGYGYTAIIVAWLARLAPWATFVVSVMLGALLVGSDMLQIVMNLPVAVAYLLQGLILFAVLGVEFLTGHRLVWKDTRRAAR